MFKLEKANKNEEQLTSRIQVHPRAKQKKSAKQTKTSKNGKLFSARAEMLAFIILTWLGKRDR